MSDEKKPISESEESSFSFDKANLEDNEVQEIHDQLRREKSEPKEGNAAPPMLLLFMCMALSLWFGFYFMQASPGGIRWDVFDPNHEIGGSGAAQKVYDPIAAGKKVYNNCIACHQASGDGIPGVYPPLAGSDWIGKSPEIIGRIVLNGLSGEIEVNGTTYNNAMTPFNNLSDKKIAAVISYIRNSWGNSHPVVPEAEIAAIRASVGGRATAYTASELLELFPE